MHEPAFVGAEAEADGGWTRRRLLSVLCLTGGALACGVGRAWPDALATGPGYRFATGKRLGTIAFTGEGDPPMGAPFGAELDGRLVTDLVKLPWDGKTVPTKDFYIRTRASRLLDPRKPWQIRLGDGESAAALGIDELRHQARSMGVHVMECSGNSKARRFGLLSAADWRGVPLLEVLDRLPKPKQPSRILVSGFDTYVAQSRGSVPGASWLFARDEIERAGAFLATEMSGAPLPADHGAPVRLVVPDWYGCSCIKWVKAIGWVPEDTASTSQMLEYGGRTGQKGNPALARDYAPAAMDPAAMPVRVEQWLVAGRIRYWSSASSGAMRARSNDWRFSSTPTSRSRLSPPSPRRKAIPGGSGRARGTRAARALTQFACVSPNHTCRRAGWMSAATFVRCRITQV